MGLGFSQICEMNHDFVSTIGKGLTTFRYLSNLFTR